MYKPIKELGQNFLIDNKVARDMVEAVAINGETDLIEIGPGHGVLTQLLVQQITPYKSTLYAVELDRRLYEKLSLMFLDDENVEVICQNILDFLPEFSCEKKFNIIGSLPYYITSPILHKIIKMKVLPEECVFLVQKEVAEKIKSKSPDSSYLSSFVQTFFDVFYLGKVDAKKFNPVPEVDGGIIKLVKKEGMDDANQKFIEKYEGFLHKAYSHPRKMLNKVFSAKELDKAAIQANIRAQNLDASEWLSAFKVLNPEIRYEI
jgi:16S rRNA (adenine1518-N6/adenine1519-N6)-dimethyltransferase